MGNAATHCVHPPKTPIEGFDSLAVPTYRGSTIVFSSLPAFQNRYANGLEGYSYGLHGTPTTRALEQQLDRLHDGSGTTLAPSGLAAITITLLSILRPGDHILIPNNMYGPAARFCHQFLGPFGISVTVYEPGCGGEIRRLITERTKLIWLESPGSNTMEVEDVPAIVSAARERTVTVACDNTWSTPLLFKPLNHGVDIAIEALTKYVGGHSDLLLGSITARTSGLHEIIKTTARGLGMGVSPDDASLTLRGLQTLSVRLAHVGNAALGLATRLTKVDCIETVLHPGLPSCPGHEFWKRDFAGSSGVFSVVLKEGSQPHLGTALAAMNVFALGASWGGTRSLIVPIPPNHEPAPESRRSGQIIRLSIGLEDPEDLWADLTRFITALEGIETA